MKPSSSFTLLAVSSTLISASVIPAKLQGRATGSRSDPIWINIDCTGAQNLCDSDCMSILCYNSPNPVQYGAKINTQNRIDSGYSSGLLRTTENTRKGKGILISDAVLDTVGRSDEETIMANTYQGGVGEIHIPGDPDENSRE